VKNGEESGVWSFAFVDLDQGAAEFLPSIYLAGLICQVLVRWTDSTVIVLPEIRDMLNRLLKPP
jgi:hypothetical protein